MTIRRTWPVWERQVEHRVDVAVHGLTGSARVLVDGTEVCRRSPWHMDMSGFELPFAVGNRPCVLIVRQQYGAQPQIDLYSEGRSLSTGEALVAKREAERRELPNLVRMLLIFIPLIGAGNTLLLRSNTIRRLDGWGPWLLLGAGLAIAGVGWWLASRWYARAGDTQHRHLVGGAIVAVAWVAFLGVLVTLLSSARA